MISKTKALLVISALLAAPLLNAQDQSPTPSTSAPQTVTNPALDNARQGKDILTKTIEALGGQRYLNFTDEEVKGRGYGFYRNEASGTGLGFHLFYKYPDRERLEFFKKASWVIIHNGGKGYETTFRGTMDEDPEDNAAYNRRREFALDYVLRGWLADPKTAIFYDGQSFSTTHEVYKITLMNAQNQGVTLLIDTHTYLPVRKSFSYRDPATRDRITEEETFDEWHFEDGVNTAHKISRYKNGDIQSERFLNQVHYNVDMPDTLFIPPPGGYNLKKK